jgi:hypothetical protein
MQTRIITVAWCVTSCSSVEIYRRFSNTMKMEHRWVPARLHGVTWQNGYFHGFTWPAISVSAWAQKFRWLSRLYWGDHYRIAIVWWNMSWEADSRSRISPPCKVRCLFHQNLKITQLKHPFPPQLHILCNIIKPRLSLHLAFQCCLHLWSPHACYMFRSSHHPSLCNGIKNGGRRRSWGPSIGRFLQPLFISSLLGPNILYTLRPNTLNLNGLLSAGMKRGAA